MSACVECGFTEFTRSGGVLYCDRCHEAQAGKGVEAVVDEETIGMFSGAASTIKSK